MAKAETAARPRGTKPVSQAFFTALESIPEAQRSAVGKAAVAMIRDEMKSRREKEKAATAKAKAAAKTAKTKTPAAATAPAAAPAKSAKATPAKAVATKRPVKAKTIAPTNGAKPTARRGRKTEPTASEA